MLEAARAKLASEEAEVELLEGDGRSLPFADGKVDPPARGSFITSKASRPSSRSSRGC
jgi:ubiquinone/menaquinone biosynthesis C-methylase UbiE